MEAGDILLEGGREKERVREKFHKDYIVSVGG